MKLYLISGHHNNDSGAVALGYKENELTIEFRNLILAYIKNYSPRTSVIIDDDNDTLSEVISTVNSTVEKDDIIIDIHFNSFNGEVSGTECFIPKVSSNLEKNIANEICVFYSETMKIPNRGVKIPSQSARGSLGILKGLGHRILIEICFLDNKYDIQEYIKYKYILANGTAEILEKYLNENS